jgi:ribose transport system permease protein
MKFNTPAATTPMLVDSKSIMREKIKPIIFVYSVLILLIVVAQIMNPGFASPSHLETFVRQSAFLGLCCIGQTLIILTGGIDLSVAQMLVLTNIVSAEVMNGKDDRTFLALIVCLIIGAGAGLANGAGIHFLKIPAMVMTLAMGNVLLGIAYIYSQGSPSGHRSNLLDHFVNDKAFGLTYGPTLVYICLSVLALFILKFTTFGRSIYMLGTNPEAARYSGVRLGGVIIGIYVIQGVLIALTGYLLVGYTGTGYMSTGDAYGTTSIAAVVVGGISVLGGKGNYLGTIAGAFIMTIIVSLMTMVNIPESGRQMAQGLIIVVLLIVIYREKKSER